MPCTLYFSVLFGVCSYVVKCLEQLTGFQCLLQDNECVFDSIFGGVTVSRSTVCRSDVLETKLKIRDSFLCLFGKTKSHSRFISVAIS